MTQIIFSSHLSKLIKQVTQEEVLEFPLANILSQYYVAYRNNDNDAMVNYANDIADELSNLGLVKVEDEVTLYKYINLWKPLRGSYNMLWYAQYVIDTFLTMASLERQVQKYLNK